MNDFQKLAAIMPSLPDHVIRDIALRVFDWLSSGGSINDNYIKNQLRFAQEILEKETINK